MCYNEHVRKPRLYVDTSVIGGCYDDEFASPSRRLFGQFRRGQATAVISSLTLEELEDAPTHVREVLDELPSSAVEYAALEDEAVQLAEAYIAEGVVGRGALADAQQVAIATLHKVDVIVSWNFRHIVNLNRIRLFTSVNLRQGLVTPEIRTPLEVLADEEEL